MSRLFDEATSLSYTENGALTYNTTSDKVLDLFSMGGALRSREDSEIVNMVKKAFNEDPLHTVETLLYLRDVRGGQGERRTFHIGMNSIREAFDTTALMDAIVEVGSWKDIFKMFTLEEYAPYVASKMKARTEGSEPDLMFKYMPSVGGSRNKEAERLAKKLGLSIKEYRKMLTKERESLQIVESKMCAKKWDKIKYENVPSKAMLIYNEAFKRNDTERFGKFIDNALTTDGAIHTATLHPCDITWKYCNGASYSKELEAIWKNLPNYVTDNSNSLVVADTSGSMWGRPMSVSTALAIYFAEHNHGIFHNEYITFSSKARFVRFDDTDSLYDKVSQMYMSNICENTNLQSVFDVILNTAIDNKLTEDDMPKNIYVVSDMEFDSATSNYAGRVYTNFKAIKKKYSENGYTMPNLIFWNVDSRNDNVPAKMNEDGVALVSGYSASTFRMALSGEMNPMRFMLNAIESERYSKLAEKILKK